MYAERRITFPCPRGIRGRNKTIRFPGDFTRDHRQTFGLCVRGEIRISRFGPHPAKLFLQHPRAAGRPPLIHACLRNSSKIDTERALRHSAPAIGGKLKTFRVSEKCWRRGSAKERKWVRDFWISFNAEPARRRRQKEFVCAVFVHEILTSLSRRRCLRSYLYKTCTLSI